MCGRKSVSFYDCVLAKDAVGRAGPPLRDTVAFRKSSWLVAASGFVTGRSWPYVCKLGYVLSPSTLDQEPCSLAENRLKCLPQAEASGRLTNPLVTLNEIMRASSVLGHVAW